MCLFVALGLLLPRVTLAALWFFDETRGVYDPWWLGLLGFLFLPYTTLAWCLIHMYSGAVVMNPATMIILAVALISDTGMWHGTRRSRK